MATHNMGFYPPTGLYGSSSFVDDDAALAQSFHRKTSPIPTAGSSHAASSPPPAGWGSPSIDTDGGSEFSASSPPASDDGFGAAAHPMDAPGASSGYARREDWDLLSEMLIDDAIPGMATLPAQSFLPGNSFGAYDAFGAPPPTKQPHAAMYLPQQQHHQHSAASLMFAPPASTPFQPTQHQHNVQRQLSNTNQHQQHNQQLQRHAQLGQQNHQNAHSQQLRRSAAPMPAGFMDALLLQDDALLASRAKAAGVGSPQTTDLFPPVAMPALPTTPPQAQAHSTTSECSDSDAPSPSPSPLATKAARKAPTSTSIKQEPLSAEEAKKLRRRSQIASSVQRHREKKKCLVATLKQDLSTLTARLESLRSERKVLHSNNETLVAWEEEAITQRRKRKQSEELNQRMKKALFQQTCFLMGMRSIMTNVPAPRELHIHDWLHSYTVLTARERSARQKEYLGYFSDSKVDMARNIVLRETDAFATRLTLSNPYFSEIRVLHDGTEVIHHEEDVRLKSELSEETEYVVPGTGQVVKKYTSMFLFEERGNCTMEAFKHVALEATKAVGVFWPSPGYASHALDTVELDGSSQLIFSDLHGSMSIVDDKLTSDDQDVQLESRMICRVQHTDDDTTIAWDYADKDELYPIEGDRAIRRDSCGAAIVRREPGGKISFRSVCVKMFGPLDSHETASNQDKALTQRRISLQASELERQNQKCTRSVYESLAGAFTRSVSIQSSA